MITTYPPQVPIQTTNPDGTLTNLDSQRTTKELKVSDASARELLVLLLREIRKTNIILEEISGISLEKEVLIATEIEEY